MTSGRKVAVARGLFAELRRRNVLRAAVLYVGAVWALAQGIAQLGPTFGAPDWITRAFVVAAAIAGESSVANTSAVNGPMCL